MLDYPVWKAKGEINNIAPTQQTHTGWLFLHTVWSTEVLNSNYNLTRIRKFASEYLEAIGDSRAFMRLPGYIVLEAALTPDTSLKWMCNKRETPSTVNQSVCVLSRIHVANTKIDSLKIIFTRSKKIRSTCIIGRLVNELVYSVCLPCLL